MKKRNKALSGAISTEASKRLAALFAERDGCPELHKREKKYLPEEKKFNPNAKF